MYRWGALDPRGRKGILLLPLPRTLSSAWPAGSGSREQGPRRRGSGGGARRPPVQGRPPGGASSPTGLPNPSPCPTPRAPPARGRRESGAAAAAAPARLAPGRGGEGSRRPARPALWPWEGAAGTRHSLPGDAEGGRGRRAERLGHPAPSPGPHDSARQGGERGGSFLTGPVDPHSPLPASRRPPFSPHLPFLCHRFCIIRCWEKGTETRKEGSRRGGAVLRPPSHGQTPEAGEQGEALVPSPCAPETRIAEVGPHRSEIHYCFCSPGAAGDRAGPPLQQSWGYIHHIITSRRSPPREPLVPNLSFQLNEVGAAQRGWGRGAANSEAAVPRPTSHCLAGVRPRRSPSHSGL